MTNTLIGLLSAGVLAVGGLAAAAGLGDSDPARTVSLPAATSTEDTTTAQDTTTEQTTTAAATTADSEVEDLSGPCDEAEHANDPRCTGGGTDEDRSGSNKGSDDDHDSDNDRSGSNSGRG